MKNSLAKIVLGLWLALAGTTNCSEKENVNSSKKIIPETIPVFMEGMENMGEESNIPEEELKKLRKATYQIKVEAEYDNGYTYAYSGTAFAFKKEGDKVYFTTANHVVEVEGKKNNSIEDILSGEPFITKKIGETKYFLRLHNTSIEIELELEKTFPERDSAILSTNLNVPYWQSLKIGDKSMIKANNLYLLGYLKKNKEKEIFSRCLPLSPRSKKHDIAICFVPKGSSRGPVLAYNYLKKSFYVVGQVNAAGKMIFQPHLEYLHYTPIRELKEFLEKNEK